MITDQCGIRTALGRPVVPELKERSASFVFFSSCFIWNFGGSDDFSVALTMSSRVGNPSETLVTFVLDGLGRCRRTIHFDEIPVFSQACTVATAASGWTTMALTG